jgi:hypothetical protein
MGSAPQRQRRLSGVKRFESIHNADDEHVGSHEGSSTSVSKQTPEGMYRILKKPYVLVTNAKDKVAMLHMLPVIQKYRAERPTHRQRHVPCRARLCADRVSYILHYLSTLSHLPSVLNIRRIDARCRRRGPIYLAFI